LSVTDLGEHRLKDIDGAVSIFQLGGGSFPPLKTISNTNLPRPASSFVGREHELSEVLTRIEGGARLVTLTGPGGSGKTRLALEAASSLVPEYKAGVFWVGLASLRDPALVTETISQTLGAKDGLAEHIQEREMLLLLDNLEQVIEAAPELSALLSACPNLTLLVTSREVLRVQGEVEYPVPPLAEPEAVSLFCERAQVDPSEEIGELCARLDNLPLAVELAAARVKALTPAQILERLSLHLDLLKGGRDADPRQQTLRATIAWSYDLLTAEEQQLFARLAVFAGGSTLEAAEEVAGADLDTLQSLVEKSLLRFTNERYWMLETIREYAEGKLAEAPDIAALRGRHAAWVFKLARHAEPLLEEDNDLAFQIEPELANVRRALDWYANEPERFEQLASALWRFWSRLTHADEGRALFARCLTFDLGVEVRARDLRAASWIAYFRGDYTAAHAMATERQAIATAMDDEDGVVGAVSLMGWIAWESGDLATARQHFEQCVEIAERSGQGRLLVQQLTHLADLLVAQGEPEEAVRRLEPAVALAPTDGMRAFALGTLGPAYIAVGDYERAREVLRDVLTHHRTVGSEVDIALTLEKIALVLASEGKSESAAKLIAFAEGWLDTNTDLVRGPAWVAERDRVFELIRGLPLRELDTRMAEGRAMSLDEGVEYALASID
jgi:non-specific serine/threonine protein kinase